MREFTVGQNDAGQRLDRFVGKAVPLLPSALTQKYIRLKRIKVNDRGAKADVKLCAGDTIKMYINDEFFEKPREDNAFLRIAKAELDLVFEDENILLVNKPAGLLCHPDGEWSYNTLISRIQAYLYAKGEYKPRSENAFSPALCNRIDRNTSGIVIAAKNAETLRIMNDKIRAREIDKYYLTVVRGTPRPAAGELRGYLFKDAVKNQVFVRSAPEKGAKTAVTQYRTLASRDGLSLLECRLLTGRTHQIRAQLAAAGYPLLGDGKYGREKQNKRYGESGQLLCSYKLKFAFETDAESLNYLRGREFALERVGFAEKYFPGLKIH